MDSSSSSLCCPGCQRPLEPGRAQGLCPRCLLARAAFATEAEDSPPLSPAPDLPTVAAAFPQLEVLELIGRGGMGVVYRARQKSLNRPVALKLLAPGRERDPAFAGRFAREARALAALNHPNIVTVHDFGFAQSASAGEAGGFYFLLMEFVDGVNLRQAMKAGRFTPEQALAIVPPVCTALQFAHERGIVHRDIKPENLLLDKDGRIKIADFGIAKMLGTDDGGRRGDASPSTSPDVSGEGNGDQSLPTSAPTQVTAAGTPQYMAPEQRDPAGRSDHRADIYSLGVVLYELLTGELPGVRLQPPSHKVQLDVRLDEIVLRALAVQPELRFATAAEFRTRLDTVATRVSGSAGTGPGSGHLPRLLKSSGGLLYRPEELDTVEGQFCVWKRRGQLVLDEQRLTFVRGDQQTVVPLAAIRDVSVGGFPRSMNPAGVDLVSVTFEEGGRNQRLLLAPMDGWFAWPATWNERVADWAAALRHAVAAAAGKEPAATLRERLPRAGRGGVGLLISLSYVVPLLALLALLGLKRTPSPGDGTLFVVVCGFFAVLWMMPGQAGTRCRSPRRIWGILLLLAALGVGMISLERQVRHRRVMAETQQTALARLRDALEQEEAIRKQLAEWTRRTANPADETQRSHDQIGRSRLQRELDSSAQRRLELERTLGRGVPQPDHSGPLWAMPPLLLGGLWLLLRPGTGTSPDTKPRRWMQWLGGVCLLLGVPLAGFAAWIGLQIAQDSSWNPTPAEAFTTVAVGLGSVLLLGGGVTLLAFARPGSRSGTMMVPVIATLLAGLAFLGVTWIYTRAHYAPTGQPFP